MRSHSNYNVGIYCRLSRDDNNGSTESMSIANQKQMLTAYVDERGWTLQETYIDDGYSGTTFDRPDFQRMIGDIQNGKINMVITKDLSRLGRNYIMTGQYTDFFFPQNGVRYIAINDNVDTLNDDNDIAPFKNILNEMYAKDISKKIRSARAVSAKQGKFMGSKAPFGYVKSPADRYHLIVDEKTSGIIKRIFSLFASGESARHIANILNEEGIPSPRAYYYEGIGKVNPNVQESDTWSSAGVMQLMRNPVYIGKMVQGKRRVMSFKTKQREVTPKDEWVVVENTHEALIDAETWERVQERIISNKRARVSHTGEISLFSGIVRCGDCGAAMVFNKKSYSGRTYYIYKCSRYVDHGKSVCTLHSISLSDLEESVLMDIQNNAKLAAYDQDLLLKRLINLSNQGQQKELSEAENILTEGTRKLEKVDVLARKLFEEKCSGNVPDSIFKKLMLDYEHEKEILKSDVDEAKKVMLKLRNQTQNVKSCVERLKRYMNIESLDRKIVTDLIESIKVYEANKINGVKQQTITVHYRLIGNLTA
jgi:site-specific DNA recombinase